MREHATTPPQTGLFAFRPTRTQIIRFIFSLLIATLLWGWVTELNDPFITVKYRELDISAEPLDDSLNIVTTLPRASVTLRGPQSKLDEIERNEISVTLDTSEVTAPGEYRLELLVTTPDGPSERTVEPTELPVTIEEEISEIMPIEVRRVIPEDDPREITSISPETTQVTVSGPSSAVNRVDKVLLPVTVDNHPSSFEEVFTPYAVDTNGQRVSEVQVLPGQISTTVEVQTRGKRVSIIPVVNGVPAEGFSMQQRSAIPDSIVVDGPEDALESLLFINTEPVDITGATQSISRQVGLSNLPTGVTVIEPASGRVEVRVAIEDTSSSAQTLTGLPVQPINLGPGLTASIDPASIDVTVDGPGDTLSNMTPSDVKIRIDLANLDTGTYEIRPEITVPQGVTWVSNSPEMVEVTITPESEGESESTPVTSNRVLEGHAAIVPQNTPRTTGRTCLTGLPRV
jgi:YbbR domain-containing protein